MFAHRAGHYKARSLLPLFACICALFLLAGCGGDRSDAVAGSTDEDAPAANVSDADPGDVKVIEDWSNALRQGDVDAAAGYFAIPSTAQNGPFVTKINSLQDAVAFNDSLPCGAEVISARTQGELTTATFKLTDRPGGDCGAGIGGKASTSFDIEDGKIVEWRRIDDGPGPGAGGGGSSSSV